MADSTCGLVGIVLAYPHDISTGAVRSTLDLSIAVSENFGNGYAVVAGAVNIVAVLCAKVDVLVEKSQEETAVRLEKIQVVTVVQEVDVESLPDGFSQYCHLWTKPQVSLT